jgi:ribosomal protein S27AE
MNEPKICPQCGCPLFVDDWGGWKWICGLCDYTGDYATPEELKNEGIE